MSERAGRIKHLDRRWPTNRGGRSSPDRCGSRLELQGAGDEASLNAHGMLGRALTDAGRYAEAEQILVDVVAGRTRLLGPDAAVVAQTRHNL